MTLGRRRRPDEPRRRARRSPRSRRANAGLSLQGRPSPAMPSSRSATGSTWWSTPARLRDPARRLDARRRGDRRRRRARHRDGVHRRAALPALSPDRASSLRAYLAKGWPRLARPAFEPGPSEPLASRGQGTIRFMTRADAFGSLLAFVARLITGAQGHWKGCPPKAEQRIYFANHQSHFDWVLIWAALPRELRASTRPIAAQRLLDRDAVQALDHARSVPCRLREPFASERCRGHGRRGTGSARAPGRGADPRRFAGDLSRRHAQQQAPSRKPSRAACTTWPRSSRRCS